MTASRSFRTRWVMLGIFYLVMLVSSKWADPESWALGEFIGLITVGLTGLCMMDRYEQQGE